MHLMSEKEELFGGRKNRGRFNISGSASLERFLGAQFSSVRFNPIRKIKASPVTLCGLIWPLDANSVTFKSSPSQRTSAAKPLQEFMSALHPSAVVSPKGKTMMMMINNSC